MNAAPLLNSVVKALAEVSAERDFSKLCEEKLVFDPERVLEALKTKSKGIRIRESSTEESSQTR